jgi:sec-independent protein translocase protein TatC
MADEKQGESLAEGTLISHLLELRNRLMKAVIALFVAFIPCAIYANDLFTLVARPLIDKLPEGSTLLNTNVVGSFMTPFKVAFYVALFIAMPVVLYQIWAFVAPGLYKRE